MAFVETRTKFPSFPGFQRSKDFFKSGLGGPPQVQLSGGVGGVSAPSPGVTQPASTPFQPTSTPAVQPPPATTAPGTTVPPAVQQQQQQPTYTPTPLGYGTAGQDLQSRLFEPVQAGTQAGEQQLTEFADLFRTQAGPSRTFAGIGGEQQLESAVLGGPIDPAQQLVGAQYQGPFGLDPEAAGGLMDLTGRLRARQAALGTGGGISEILRQTTPGTTGGEARYTARDVLTPEYRGRLAEVGAGIDPLAGRLEEEILGTQAFAQQRAGEEQDIAQQAREYLGGRGAGITSDIEAEVARRSEQERQTEDIWSQIQTGDQSPEELATLLREAQTAGALDPSTDVGALNTEFQQAIAAAPQQREAIMGQAKYASIKDAPIGELGVDKKGRQTYLIDGKDFRQVLGKKSQEAVLFKQRQGELEEQFSSARGVPFPGGRPSGERFGEAPLGALADPLYFGGDADMPQIKQFLDFDPGVRPSRGNVSTEEQRGQFNRIQEILGNLDRISKDTTPFKAGIILASVGQYLAAEEEFLSGQVETLDQQGKQWFNDVKRARKRVRKAERKEDYGKIATIVGGVLLAGVGGTVGGIAGGLLPTLGGFSLGGGVGMELGQLTGGALA